MKVAQFALYYMMVHPSSYYSLKVIIARDSYKHKQWIPRWERWSGRKYIEVEGELGDL